MPTYFMDYETKSGLNLKKVGKYRYLRDPEADIVMLTWTDGTHPAKLWLPGMPVPFKLNAGDKACAFNIGFDRDVQNILGKRYGLPRIEWEQCIDLMAVCARLALPQNLENACKVLNLKNQKLAKLGNKLKDKICKPPFKYTKEEFKQFVRYCLVDTEALVEMAQTLPTNELHPDEQSTWVRTQKMNEAGICIDVPMAKRISACVKVYKGLRNRYLQQVTEGELKTAGQVAKIREYCEERGVTLHDLKAQTVRETLEDPNLDARVRRVLEIRQDVSATSVKKFESVLERVGSDGKLHDLLVYHAASTGRYSSRGLQIHNLAREGADNPDELIETFYDGRVFSQNVVTEAKKLVRSMIVPNEGDTFIISDFSSIEYVVCCWLAGDIHHLSEFARGRCPYKSFGVQLLNKHYDDITKGERQQCKPGVLGGIYGLSGNGYVEYAKGYGVKATPAEGARVINIFRKKYNMIKTFWYELQDIAICAVMQPGFKYEFGHIKASSVLDHKKKLWLLLELPSGRTLTYYEPKIGKGKYGDIVTHMGIDSTTQKWVRKQLSITRLVENVTQATARDLLTHCEARINREVPSVQQVFSCHDEVVVECSERTVKYAQEDVHKIMSTPPKWAGTLPLRAETFTSRRYTKG